MIRLTFMQDIRIADLNDWWLVIVRGTGITIPSTSGWARAPSKLIQANFPRKKHNKRSHVNPVITVRALYHPQDIDPFKHANMFVKIEDHWWLP